MNQQALIGVALSLKVLSLNGYYDVAKPFFATECDVAHLMLDAPLWENVQFRYYPSGHMIYLNPEAPHQLHSDLSSFYDATVGAAAAGRSPGQGRQPR